MKISAFLLASLGIATAQSFYSNPENPVIELNPKNFDEIVHSTNYTTIVEFYAPWCGHCKNLKHAYQEVAKATKGLVQVAAIDCDLQRNKQLCAAQGIQGFPTVKVFRPPKWVKGKPAKRGHIGEVYNGARETKPIIDFVADRIKNYVVKLNGMSALEKFTQDKSSKHKVILFSSNGKLSSLIKMMAIDYLGVMDFAYIDMSKVTGDLTRFCKGKESQLVVLDTESGEFTEFTGKGGRIAYYEFLREFEENREGPGSKREKRVAKLAKKKYSPGVKVEENEDVKGKKENVKKAKKAPVHDEL